MPTRKNGSPAHDPNVLAGEDVTREELEEIERLMMEELNTLPFRATQVMSSLAVNTADFAEQVRPHYEEGQAFVRQHPGIALLGAFALGVALGGFLTRA